MVEGLGGNYERIPDSHYAALGRAICTYSDLEFVIDRATWRLAGKEQAPLACFTSQYHSVFNRINALISLVCLFELSPDAAKKLKKLSAHLASLNEERNRLVHDCRLARKSGEVVRFEVTAKSVLEFGIKPETVESLHDFCRRVDEKREEFFAIWKPILQLIERQPELLDVQFGRIDLHGLEQLDQPSPHGSHLQRPRRLLAQVTPSSETQSDLHEMPPAVAAFAKQHAEKVRKRGKPKK